MNVLITADLLRLASEKIHCYVSHNKLMAIVMELNDKGNISDEVYLVYQVAGCENNWL
jgi:hypothetical protein